MSASGEASSRSAGEPGAWLHSPLALAAAVVAVYALSLGGGWLEYDDDWLVRDNELLSTGRLAVIARMLFDWDRETRMILGAEYLPVRDATVFLARGVAGLESVGLRITQLVIYVAGVLCLQRWARAALPRAGLLSVWLFALHPVHAESVAWLAGMKDVLALFFVSASLLAYGSDSARVRLLAIPLLAFGCFSKSMAVVTPLVLLVHDLAVRRRPDVRVIAPGLAIASASAAMHAWVGSVVGMYAEPIGRSKLEGALVMAEVLVRYLRISLFVHPHSVIYEVGDTAGAGAIAAAVLLSALAGGALVAARRGTRWPLVALLLFAIPLLPVSQVLAPLQNRMADRYLLVSVLGPMLALASMLDAALASVRPTVAGFARGALVATVGVLGLVRAQTFADRVALFSEATESTEHNAVAPFLLAEAHLARSQLAAAETAYRVAIERDGLQTDRGRRAGNNLARLLVGQGRANEALDLYRVLVERYPGDPRVLHNLAVMEARLGDAESAERHRDALRSRFPDYAPGRDRPGPL